MDAFRQVSIDTPVEQFGKPEQRGERRAQLVRGRRKKAQSAVVRLLILAIGLGALCLIHDQVRELDDEELQLLETLAAEVTERLTGEDAAPVSEPEVPAPSASVGQQVPD